MKRSHDGRKPIRRSLPPLAEAFPSFTKFSKGENRTERVSDFLLETIQRHRRAEPRPFYSLREVATFFGISVTMVALIYRRLARNGALILVRGSQTMIPARESRPRFAIRGVVCMPIWLPGFLNFLDWRRRFSELEEELSRHRFVLEPIFFRNLEDGDPAFLDRVLKFNPDYVLWDSPSQSDRMTMESILDAGVPILTILEGRDRPRLGRIYRRSFKQGLQRGLKDWESSGEIDRIVVPQAGREHLQHDVLDALDRCSLPHEMKFYNPPTPSLSLYLKGLAPKRRTGIIFSDGLFFAKLCAMVPEKILELFRRHRVMVLRQVTMHSFTMPDAVTVDSLLHSNKRLAQRIAADLSQSRGALPSEEEIFEAEWRPHTPFKDVAQINVDE